MWSDDASEHSMYSIALSDAVQLPVGTPTKRPMQPAADDESEDGGSEHEIMLRVRQLENENSGQTKADATSSSTSPFLEVSGKHAMLNKMRSPADVREETVREVRNEIRKSSNWPALPPHMDRHQLDPSDFVSRIDAVKPLVGTEPLAKGVTFALTMCSDLVQQVSKLEERLNQVSEKSTCTSSEVVACFRRVELLREMVEMEKGVRSQDVVQLQLTLQQSSEWAQETWAEVDGRQAHLATDLTKNFERLASALDKRAQTLDKEFAQLRSVMLTKQVKPKPADFPLRERSGMSFKFGREQSIKVSSREQSAKEQDVPKDLGVVHQTTPREGSNQPFKVSFREQSAKIPDAPKVLGVVHQTQNLLSLPVVQHGLDLISTSASPKRGSRGNRSSSPSPPSAHGFDVPSERPKLVALTVPSSSSTSLRPIGCGPGLSERSREAPITLAPPSKPMRVTPDDDDRDASFFAPREQSLMENLMGFSFKCDEPPSMPGLCRPAMPTGPHAWEIEQQEFVTVEASRILDSSSSPSTGL